MRMARTLSIFLIMFSALTIGSLFLSAHHGYAAYDLTKTISLKGKVTDYEIENPHSSVAFDVETEKGNMEHWVAEFAHVRAATAAGWTPSLLKPGDVVTFYIHPAKNGSHNGALVKAQLPDGRVLLSGLISGSQQ